MQRGTPENGGCGKKKSLDRAGQTIGAGQGDKTGQDSAGQRRAEQGRAGQRN